MKKLIFALLVLSSIGSGGAVFLETTPSSIEIDQAERGEIHQRSVYLNVAEVGENQSIDIDAEPISYGNNRLFEGSLDNLERVSEEGTDEWWDIEFTEISPSNQVSPEGSSEVFDGRMDITLEIPDGADPGLRYGHLKMSPSVEAEAGGVAGSTIHGGINLRYAIDLQGPVERDISIEDVRGFRPSEDEASVELLILNSGNVRTSTESFQIDVYDGAGEVLDTLTTGSIELDAGETEWVSASWEGENVEEGNYRVDGEVNYFTGEAYVSGSFDLGDVVTIEEAPDDSPVTPDDEGANLPIWLVFMVLLILGVLMWSFEIDPIWVFGIIGFLAISTFVIYSNISNLLVVGVLVPVLVILYLGV